ncbi:MAG: plasmid maintenance system killer protein [Parcubacteria group bacterium]|nr:plasmid maintenance system killer protein [Parcubacteria group bacterium]
MTEVIARRLNQLSASPSLETMRNIGRCHELKGDRLGTFALDLVHPQRLIFKPGRDKEEFMKDGSIIWKEVIAVEIIGIEDYH